MKVLLLISALFVEILCQQLLDNLRPPAQSNTWSIIVAPSTGYYNYRHQADACRAYSLISKMVPAN